MPDVLTPKEAAAELRLSVQAVYRALRSGRLRGFQPLGPGGPWRIRREDLPHYRAWGADSDPMPKPTQRNTRFQDQVRELWRRKGEEQQ